MLIFTAIISYLCRSTQKYTLKYTFYQEYQNVSKVFITFEGIEQKISDYISMLPFLASASISTWA